MTSIQRTLSTGPAVPAAYVIGIGYPAESGFLQAIQKRNRDYTPNCNLRRNNSALGNLSPTGYEKVEHTVQRCVNEAGRQPLPTLRYSILPESRPASHCPRRASPMLQRANCRCS